MDMGTPRLIHGHSQRADQLIDCHPTGQVGCTLTIEAPEDVVEESESSGHTISYGWHRATSEPNDETEWEHIESSEERCGCSDPSPSPCTSATVPLATQPAATVCHHLPPSATICHHLSGTC